MTVNGNGSMWSNSGEVRVAGEGTGALTITGGGAVSDTSGFVVTFGGGTHTASAIVDGAGSTWTNSGNLQIGGDIAVGAGTHGTVEIRPGGKVTVAQNTVVFPNGALHLMGGTLDTAGVSRQAGSVFDFASGTLHVGNFLGNLVNQAGTLAPGHSAGRTSITGNYTHQSGATLDIEVGGISFGSGNDVVEVSGSAARRHAPTFADQWLRARHEPHIYGTIGRQPLRCLQQRGQRPTANERRRPWFVRRARWCRQPVQSQQCFTYRLRLSGVPGDFNSNGVVDAADYVVWRKTDGTPAGYNAWRTHFGQTAGSGSSTVANAAVPEPSTLVMLVLAAAGVCSRRRRAA